MNNESNTDKALKLLKDAYAVCTPEDNVKYYKDFSKIYDGTYVKSMSYIYHKCVTKELMSYFDGDGAICDIGCGTGLVGQELLKINSNLVIDGIDISPDMLKVSQSKEIYRNLYLFDLTKTVKDIPTDFKAIITSGTFTHGHLGVNALINILKLGIKRAIFTIGINKLHYIEKGFKKTIEELEARKIIKVLNLVEHDIYAKKIDFDNHENSRALIYTFRKNL